MFLDDDELRELTGKQRRNAQIRVLRSRKYPFDLDGNGRPLVARRYVERRFEAGESQPEPEVDLSALRH